MSDYIASNGVLIEHTNAGKTLLLSSPGDSWPNPEEHSLLLNADFEPALREFFLKERDDELGRWRFPALPQYVVYPLDDDSVRVVWQITGLSKEYARGEIREATSSYASAAVAYFDAHPEPKPWHEAQPGEAWVLKEQGQPERAYMVDDGQFYDSSRDYALYFKDPVILAARRIWPEDSDVSGV